MKKLIFIILALSLLIVGCTKETPQPPVEDTPKAADYFPFMENTKLSYKGEGNEYAEKDVFFDFIEGDRAQLRVMNPGTTLAQIYEVKDGEVRRLSSKEEMYAFYNTLDWLKDANQGTEAEVLLKEPIEKGNKWQLSDGRTREITSVDMAVETPHADYKAIEVTTTSQDGKSTTKDYYAKEIGLIKTEFSSEGFEVLTILEKVEKNTALNTKVNFYYPDFHNEKIVFVEEEIPFKTNDDIKQLLAEKLKQSPGEGINPVLGENVKINDILYKPDDSSVTVDFSEELVTEMNAGIFLEGQILTSIANTFGSYFNVNDVFIRKAGKTYESGHVYLEEDEPLNPRIEEAAPYNK